MTRTFGRLRYDEDQHAWLFQDVEPHVVIRLKDVFRRIPKTATGVIRLADGPDVATDLDWFLSRYPLEMETRDREHLREVRAAYEARLAEIEGILLPSWKPSGYPVFKDGVQPYPFQAQAAELTRRLRRLLLLDDVGLGKTFSALAVLTSADVLPAAIVVQSHLAEQWVEDYILPCTWLIPHIVKGTRPYDLPEADVYIFKYSNIAGWADIAGRGVFRSVVFDEVQELRHGEATSKGKAAIVFRDAVDVRVGLTATPIYNYGDEIFRVVEAIAPGALGAWYEFVREWCAPGPGGKWKVKEPEALGAYLREAQIVLRRTEEDVGGQMPPINTITHEIDYDEEVAEAAEARARMLAMRVLHADEFTERGRAARELDALARHTTGLAKAQHVSAFVRVLLESKVPVLLTGWHREVYDRWLKDLADFRPVMYTGSETSKKKRQSKEAFVAGETDLMIISLRSGSGLDGLQRRCSTVVFGELDWSPLVHRQVIGRLRRPGQDRQVDAIYLWTNGGSDPLMIETNGVKAAQARGIVDPFAGVERVHSDASRIQRLAESYLAKRGAVRSAA